MHGSSFQTMEGLVNVYMDRKSRLAILDIGSMDINGCYKSIFDCDKWIYTGIDLAPGANVDIVAGDNYHYPLPDNSFDIVVSGQVLEHVEDTHQWIKELARVLKPGGLTFIIAPYMWNEHKFPVDCWRILPDGMSFLLYKMADLEIINTYIDGNDCIGIARKRG